MKVRLVWVALAALLVVACSRSTSPRGAESGGAATRLPDPQLRTIHPREPIPHFRITTVEGAVLDSREIVGKKPLMLFFFSSWCPVCEKKMPMVREVLAQYAGRVDTYAISLDENDTWSDVAAYVRDQRLDAPLVRGEHYLNFSTAYNPLGALPWIVVVDKTGHLAEVQLGLAPEHHARLHEAIQYALRTNEPPAPSP